MKIIDDKIYMRRGDDEVLIVELQDDAGSPAEMPEGATLTLTVRQRPDDESPVLFSTASVPGSNRIIIRHDDTASTAYGEYSADVQMRTAEGLRKTVWPIISEEDPPKAGNSNLKNFVILPEVTMD